MTLTTIQIYVKANCTIKIDIQNLFEKIVFIIIITDKTERNIKMFLLRPIEIRNEKMQKGLGSSQFRDDSHNSQPHSGRA